MPTVKTANSRNLFYLFRVPMICAAFVVFMVLFTGASVHAQTTELTYQGSLKDGANAANGSYDFEFLLFDALAGGAPQGPTVTRNGAAVTNGIFAVTLDFGNQFPGAGRFLEIRVRPAGGGAFTTLSPRQPIASTPYAIKSTSSDTSTTATNSTQLGGVAASQFVQTGDPRLIDARPPTAGSANYIQNSTTLQAPSNFNISGTGTANVFNSTSDYNIFGFRVLSILGANNAFVGVGAGTANTGSQNAFFGREAGEDNTIGSRNAFFGTYAGRNNLAASDLAFFGASSGESNSSGINNAFFGSQSGRANTTGGSNSFFGAGSGQANVGGIRNSFFGSGSGFATTTGNNNSFFGTSAGVSNTTGSSNTVIGDSANVGAGNLNFATAIGAQAVVGTSNTVVLGRPADTVQIPGTLSISGTLSANIFSATTQYNIGANRILSNSGNNNLFAGVGSGAANTGFSNSFFGALSGDANTFGESNSFFGTGSGGANTGGSFNSFFGARSGEDVNGFFSNSFFGADSGRRTNSDGNSFFGASSGVLNTTGDNNSFFGLRSGRLNETGNFNSFFGYYSGEANTTGSNNTTIGTRADVGSGGLNFATAIGAEAVVTVNNRVQLGRNGLDTVRIGNLASAISTTQLCINTANVLAQCSSSRRYKENIHAFSGGLDLVRRLRPVTYDWIADKVPDLGLVAEEVAAVEPLLATYNRNGEIQGVKYDQITVVLINAVKEQQSQIERQQEQIELLIKANQDLNKRVLDIERQKPKGSQPEVKDVGVRKL